MKNDVSVKRHREDIIVLLFRKNQNIVICVEIVHNGNHAVHFICFHYNSLLPEHLGQICHFFACKKHRCSWSCGNSEHVTFMISHMRYYIVYYMY